MAVGAQSAQQMMWDLSALSLPQGPLGLPLRRDKQGLGVKVKGR